MELTTVQQLIVYFSGHGVNMSRGELWLLTGAPDDPNAAVNIARSVELARTCGIRHVAMVSDACRTAAEGIQAQSVRGPRSSPTSSMPAWRGRLTSSLPAAWGTPRSR